MAFGLTIADKWFDKRSIFNVFRGAIRRHVSDEEAPISLRLIQSRIAMRGAVLKPRQATGRTSVILGGCRATLFAIATAFLHEMLVRLYVERR